MIFFFFHRYLATGDSFRTIAFSYRFRHSTISGIVREVASAIWTALVEETMPVPSMEDWRAIADQFHVRWNFPNCLGAIDGKHVVLQAPPNSTATLIDSVAPLEVEHTYSLSGPLPISSRIRCHWIRVLPISQLKKEMRYFSSCRVQTMSLAAFTLQVLMHRSDLLTISDYLFFCPSVYIYFRYDWYSISVFTLIPNQKDCLQ